MTATTQACPGPGVWRAWLDHEPSSPDLADHLTQCAECQHLVANLREGASTAGDLLRSLAPARMPSHAEVAIARERFASARARADATAPTAASVTQGTSLDQGPPNPLRRLPTGWRVAGSAVAAALVVSLVVTFSPEAQTTAAAFLAQFRSQQVTAIEVTPQSQTEIFRTLNALGNLGTIQTPGGASRPEALARGAAQQSRTASLEEASRAVGFNLQTPDPRVLPAGLDKTPSVQIMPSTQVRFTFNAARARAYFQSTGHPEVSVPEKFDGASLVVSIPSAALLHYGDRSSREALIVGQAGELVVDVEGKVSLAEMRDFLLGLPGLPPSVVNQLKKINNWNQTLPIPIPVDQVNWQSASFKGNQGLLLNDNSSAGSAAIWYEGGRMYGVAGSLKASDLKRVADSLAVR
jgi:hypothetical protein